jgi:uncharacterized damage-inducible protein DinB
MPIPEVNVLLDLIDQAFDHSSWHGTNLRGSIRGVTAKRAAWRPAPGRHNIWELVVHAAYWKYIVRRRILGEKRGLFPLDGSNWFERPVKGQLSETAWKADVALLTDVHDSLRAAVALLTRQQLDAKPRGSKRRTEALVTGIAAHDFYHTGQIQLLKKMMPKG